MEGEVKSITPLNASLFNPDWKGDLIMVTMDDDERIFTRDITEIGQALVGNEISYIDCSLNKSKGLLWIDRNHNVLINDIIIDYGDRKMKARRAHQLALSKLNI